MSSLFREPADEAWSERYGDYPMPELPDLGAFLTHRSVRKFRPEPIPESIREGLIAVAQSAATSSNLQMWSVVEVDDPERRERIAQLSADQNQIRTAGWFLAFIADHHRLRQAGGAVGESCLGLDYAEYLIMAIVDAALAAERLVAAAEHLGIGSCYIGALRNDPAGIQEVLQLPAGAFGVFGLCLGYPAEPMTAAIKPRLLPRAVRHREVYRLDVSGEVAEYDERMRAFYEAQRMKGDVTWSSRSGRRVDEHHLGGREVLLEYLRSQGFAQR
ncbi:MAG: NADPH-dependent oxidoreductase [Methanoregulaceae archaeon]|nr:NADPH-dependent oxidoreductase [Methanoregulaceae archaeon]